MAMTRPCRCSPKAKRSPAACGRVCATTGRLVGPIHQRRAAFLFARPPRRTPRAAFREIFRHPASRRLWRIQWPLHLGPRAGTNLVGAVLGACAAQILPGCRSGAEEEAAAIADRARSGQTHRRHLRGERLINGRSADERLAYHRRHVAPLVVGLEAWMREERARLTRHAPVAKALDYQLKRWAAFSRGLCTTAEFACQITPLNGRCAAAIGREAWLFAGSDRGGDRAADMATLIQTAKLNDIDPQAWLADVLDVSLITPCTARRLAPVELATARDAGEAGRLTWPRTALRFRHHARRADARRERGIARRDRGGRWVRVCGGGGLGIGEEETTAFTYDGIQYLRDVIPDYKNRD